MKPYIFLMCLLLSGPGLLADAQAQDLVGHWTLDNSATDISGQGNHGVITGATFVADRQVGTHSLQFTAAGHRLRVGTANWSATTGTISVWVKPTAFLTGLRYIFGHTITPNFDHRIQLYTDAADGLVDVGMGNDHTLIGNAVQLQLNEWQKLDLTYNGTTAILFYNGVQVASSAYTGLTTIGQADFGNNGLVVDEAFRGMIDHAKVYRVVRTPAQILADYQSDLGSPGPVAYFGFGGAATGAGEPVDQTCTGTEQNCVYHVTTCTDNTATPTQGMLRHAAQQPNRKIVFDVACGPGSPNALANFGKTWIYFRSNTTVDGRTAPSPGFQYTGTLIVGGSQCSPRCNNVIITGMIYRGNDQNCTDHALKVERGGHTVVFDRNTMYHCANDCLGVSSNEISGGQTVYVDSRDITFSRNFINHPRRPGVPGDPGCPGPAPCPCPGDDPSEVGAETAALFDSRSRRITFAYNFIYDSARRNPRLAYDTNVDPTDTNFDIRYNLIWLIGGTGSQDGGVILEARARANVVGNYLRGKVGLTDDQEKKAVVVCKSSGNAPEDGPFCGTRVPANNVYVTGNISHDGHTTHINTKGSVSQEQSAGFVPAMDACAAAQSVRQDVGAPYKSAADTAALNAVVLSPCPEPPIVQRRVHGITFW